MSRAMLDEDTARTVDEGRAALGEFVVAARDEFRKVFLVFAVGMVGTIAAMQYYVFDILRGITRARMSEEVASQQDILVRMPFDVILLQAKIGLYVGAILALPVLVYYSREGLQRRGLWPDVSVARWKLAGLAAASLVLFAGGTAYAYYVFFPVMFEFLTTYTLNVGFSPQFDIVMWTEFIILLTASFGLAAQLPLVMSALSYSGIVPYETFRDRWRYGVVGIFVFGAFFSPPDPFTQIMWAVPLLVLFGFSLYLSKFITAARRGGSTRVREKLVANWNRIAAAFVVTAGGVYLFLANGYLPALNAQLARLPPEFRVRVVLDGLALSGPSLYAALAVAWGVAASFPVFVYYAWPELEPVEATEKRHGPPLEMLEPEGIRAVPATRFLQMDEDEAVETAGEFVDEGEPEKARAVLDRYDEVQEMAREVAEERGDGSETAGDPGGEAEAAGDPGGGGASGDDSAGASTTEAAQGAAAGILDSVTDEETTEEDIGGYYYDLAFIFESLTSKTFRIVGVFILAMAATFLALYQGGIGYIKSDFLSRLPPEVVPEGGVSVVALHPVEAIIFEVKMSAIAGAVATLPILLYYAWPAIEERFYGITRSFETDPPLTVLARRWNLLAGTALLGGAATFYNVRRGVFAVPDAVTLAGTTLSGVGVVYATAVVVGVALAAPVGAYHAWPSVRERLVHGGKQNVFLLWAGTLAGGLVVGSLLGYAYVAPAIISYLVEDAIRAEMVIAYRINNFFWLIFATTVGIGLLADVPLTMWLFHRGGVVSFETMRERWRVVVMGVALASAFFTPSSMLSMALMAVPVTVAYLLGLGGLWLVTLPWRVRDRFVDAAGR